MTSIRKVFLSAAIFIFVVFLTLVFFSYRLLLESLPKTDGEIQISVLDEPVHIYRDDYGVPHIFAENEKDLFRAIGYVQAQDRLWQMDFNRRVVSGRLSEIFGSETIDSDKFTRLWGFKRVAQEIITTLSEQSLQSLEAYTEGVNAFIDTHMDRLPVEFAILKYKPELWNIGDSVAFMRFMAWKLSFSWYVDLALHELVQKLGEQKAREIFPGFPKSGPFIIPSSIQPFWTHVEGFVNAGLELRDILGIDSAQLGSNAWAVSGEKSACGKPLLASDPHLELGVPSVWYEMHLSCPDINVAGVALPGTPVVLIGHNENVAWGITNGMVDDVDFYFEKMNSENPQQYWNGSEWANFQMVEEEIVVKGEEAQKLEIRISRNGPVISDFHPLLKDKEDAVSMHWTGHRPSDELAAVLRLQRAKNWDDFTDALRDFRVPAQNFVFASRDGDIGYYLGGAIPIRRNATGILPHRGWLDTGQWSGEVPFEEQPHVLNPPEHFIVTANNKIVGDRYPYYITNLWEPPSRATRIRELLSDKELLSIDDFKTIQMDVVSKYAQQTLPLLLKTVKAELDSSANSELQKLYDLIKTWDGEERTESIAAAIFHAFFLKVTENTLQDEMGDDLYKNYVRLGNVPSRVISSLLEKEDSEWFDDVNTWNVESREDITIKSFLDAGDLLKEMAGDNISNWKWGSLHKLTLSHPLGRRKPLDAVFNLGPYARAGSKMTVNNAEYRFSSPFDANLGASTRQLVDFCDSKHSLSVLPSGQSGQRMSDHYKDQTDMWLKGDYHPMVMDQYEIRHTASERLVLKP